MEKQQRFATSIIIKSITFSFFIFEYTKRMFFWIDLRSTLFYWSLLRILDIASMLYLVILSFQLRSMYNNDSYNYFLGLLIASLVYNVSIFILNLIAVRAYNAQLITNRFWFLFSTELTYAIGFSVNLFILYIAWKMLLQFAEQKLLLQIGKQKMLLRFAQHQNKEKLTKHGLYLNLSFIMCAIFILASFLVDLVEFRSPDGYDYLDFNNGAFAVSCITGVAVIANLGIAMLLFGINLFKNPLMDFEQIRFVKNCSKCGGTIQNESIPCPYCGFRPENSQSPIESNKNGIS